MSVRTAGRVGRYDRPATIPISNIGGKLHTITMCCTWLSASDIVVLTLITWVLELLKYIYIGTREGTSKSQPYLGVIFVFT